MDGFGNELIINFMFDYINRFISFSQNEECYNKFFGCDNWKEAEKLQRHEREIYLLNLFKGRVKEITKSKFVFAYKLCYPDKNQTYYYLIHATNHLDGITLMKNSFASVNNGRVEYLGKNNDIPSLFDIAEIKTDEMYNQVLKTYSGVCITFEKLWKSLVEDTLNQYYLI